jgi:hypothetical protein
MQLGLKTVTEAMGTEVFLLGCGAPVGSMLGNVHANRVSADAGLAWSPSLPLPFYDKWNLPCARYIFMYIFVYAFIYIYIYLYIYICMYKYVYIFTFNHKLIFINTHIYIMF